MNLIKLEKIYFYWNFLVNITVSNSKLQPMVISLLDVLDKNKVPSDFLLIFVFMFIMSIKKKRDAVYDRAAAI